MLFYFIFIQTFFNYNLLSIYSLITIYYQFIINLESKLSKSSIGDIEIFEYINAYKPENIEIKFLLKPFLLDYIPAIGDVDTFIKIPRPDGVVYFYFIFLIIEFLLSNKEIKEKIYGKNINFKNYKSKN